MQDEEIRARGWSVPIYRAVKEAGGEARVAAHLGLKTSMAARHWYTTRSIRAHYIIPLCVLCGYAVKPDEILADLALVKEAA